MAETKETKSEEQEDHSNGWLGDFVRLTIMVWAMGVITANYLGIFKQSIDVTFSASLLSSTAASYGLSVGLFLVSAFIIYMFFHPVSENVYMIAIISEVVLL